MSLLATSLIVLVAVLHVGFLVLEMFLWTRPIGLRVMHLTPDKALYSKVLAFNQGLYNGFLAAGLITGLLIADHSAALFFEQFFLICVIIAGIVGGLSSNFRIFLIQGIPAIFAMIALCLT